jgi:hypothetical protein
VLAVAGLAVVTVGGVAGCDPGAVTSATVAYTTDQTVTKELNREHAGVRWLNCNASYGDHGVTPSGTDTVASVDCKGQTNDGKDITVTGKVTRAVSGACIRGNITAKVGGKQWFRVDGLGNCNATTAPNNPTNGQPGPTVTVTVTKTLWCQGDPKCWPVEGK